MIRKYLLAKLKKKGTSMKQNHLKKKVLISNTTVKEACYLMTKINFNEFSILMENFVFYRIPLIFSFLIGFS